MQKMLPVPIRGWLFTMCAGTVAALIVSGSREPAHEQGPANYRKSREDIEAALRVVESRLVVLERDGSLQRFTQHDSLRHASPAVLRARNEQILARLEALESASASEQRGALPGLRAALADLEHRTDIAQLSAADSAAALDATVSAWLTEIETQLDRAESTGARSVVATQRDAFTESRREHSQLALRFEALRRPTSAADMRARRALAEALADLRRDVRALVRSIGTEQTLVMG